MPPREQLSAGRQFECTDNIKELLNCNAEGYDFVFVPVAHPYCCYKQDQLPDELPPISRPDLLLTSQEWSRLVITSISPWIDVDSSDDRIRQLSEQALRSELAYFTYLCVPAILLELKGQDQPNLRKIINEFVESPGGPVIWAIVPTRCSDDDLAQTNDAERLPNGHSGPTNGGYVADGGAQSDSGQQSSPSVDNGFHSTDGNGEVDFEEEAASSAVDSQCFDSWQWFHAMRRACDNKQRLGLVLKITADLPEQPNKLKRWLGEPLKAFLVDTHLFTTNEKGFPVLPKAHQNYIRELYTQNCQAVVTGPTLHHNKSTDKTKACLYLSYLNFLFKNKPTMDIVTEWALGYEDCLQIPLQPLGDNLESQIYEIFERDPVKYVEYKKAVMEGLLSIRRSRAAAVKSSDEDIVLMILGAGRGPLVTATVEAMEFLSIKAKVYAIEKNQNAIVTLNHLAATKWQNKVTVVHSDMRDFRPKEEDRADLVVSELLGSFGDNELSPECLDGALHVMKPNCISIPMSYTSYLAPIQSPKLHQTVRVQAGREDKALTAFESSYVVRVHNHFLPSQPQPLFTFTHPNFDLKTNDRYKRLTFIASECCDLSGLVGYFHSDLFFAVPLSIVPNGHTPGLFSWFPIYFPFKDPIYVKKGEKIVIDFWRCSDARQVWYEWAMALPIQTPIMNPKGRSSFIRKL